MLFKKKKTGSVEIKLKDDQFCVVMNETSEDVKTDYCIIANGKDHYNLFYRDGRFLGMPQPSGGPIYPFSKDPTKKGSKHEKKKFRTAEIVCLSKAFRLKVFWSTKTPFIMEEANTDTPYKVMARGVFYVNIDPSDAATNADKFYNKCLTQRDAALFNTEALREFLADAFIIHIGAKIQDYIENSGRSLKNYVGLKPNEILKVSQSLCPKMSDIYESYGLSIDIKSSEGSILEVLDVKPIE